MSIDNVLIFNPKKKIDTPKGYLNNVPEDIKQYVESMVKEGYEVVCTVIHDGWNIHVRKTTEPA